MQKRRSSLISLLLLLSALGLGSCWKLRGHYGGPQSFAPVNRALQPADIALPAGYRIEALAQGLTYPTALAFDEAGQVYVTEGGYSYGEIWTPPRLLKLSTQGHLPWWRQAQKTAPGRG